MTAPDPILEAEIERALAPYRNLLPPDAIEEMRSVLAEILLSHPVTSLYLERIRMGGFKEEVYEATYRAAQCASATGWPRAYVERRLHDAHLLQPYRAEPLYRIALGRFHVGQVREALPFALAAFDRPPPTRNWCSTKGSSNRHFASARSGPSSAATWGNMPSR